MPDNKPESELRCPYRSNVRQTDEGEVAVCGLAGEISGIADPEILTFQRGACVACGRCFPPTRDHLNPVVASVVHIVGERVLEHGGVKGCDIDQARKFMGWATAFLKTVSVASRIDSLPLIPYEGNCFYLGEHIGEKPCIECKGSVTQKTFSCHHENYDETAILQCQHCEDYELELKLGGVRTWAVGVTTAPRTEPTLVQSLSSLAKAGWPAPLLFVEPHTELPEGLDPHRVIRRIARLGAWPNWLLGLHELVLRSPRADAYLMCQDDVLYVSGLRPYLEESLWPASRLGVVSLHTASHQNRSEIDGFYSADLGWDAWGAQAYVFSNASARALLRHPMVNNHRHRGARGGLYNVDSIVGAWCRRTKLSYFLHHPSLTQHVGDASTLWQGGGTLGRRSAGTFPGEEIDIEKVMSSGGEPSASAESPESPESLSDSGPEIESHWRSKSLSIATPLVGRLHPFARWKSWMRECDLPDRASVVLVENSRNPKFSELLAETAVDFREDGRFESVDIIQGPGFAPGVRRLSMEKHQSVADAFNLALSDLSSDYVLTIDCDTIPEPDAIERLGKAMEDLKRKGERPGAISGCYESATNRGFLVASRELNYWGHIPRVGELVADEIVQVGFTGTGCLLIDGEVLRELLPLGAKHGDQEGPDSFLCAGIRRLGYTVWLHGGVWCDHIIG